MNFKNFKVLIFAMLLFQCSFAIAQQKKREKTEKEQIVLFDGTLTDAWKDIKSDKFPAHGWVVKDGILTVLPKTEQQEGGHDIVTKQQFSNFELELEVRY